MKLFRRYTAVLVTVLLLSTAAFGQHHPRFDTIRERIESRSYPSVFSTWQGHGWRRVHNRPDLTDSEIIALHDLYFTHSFTGVRWHYVEATNSLELLGVVPSDIPKAERLQREMKAMNPNIVYLMEIRIQTAASNHRAPPADSSYWLRYPDGNRVKVASGAYLVDFTHPETQAMIIQQAIAVAQSGFFDGIMFDWWDETRPKLNGLRTYEEEQAARDNIIRGIRDTVTHPDFLILVNMNHDYRRVERNAHLINGGFMESWRIEHRGVFTSANIAELENTLRWLEQNTREPRINCLEGRAKVEPTELNDPDIVAWMRLFTTMSLVHSDGYVLYARHPGHWHNWYEFWDTDLGQPISAKSESVSPDCFRREYENGWAISNRSSQPHTMTFGDYVLAVSTGEYAFVHEVPPKDGEIFLKSHPTTVSPRDKLATMWGTLKQQ